LDFDVICFDLDLTFVDFVVHVFEVSIGRLQHLGIDVLLDASDQIAYGTKRSANLELSREKTLFSFELL
jgi:hypothetical protein